MISKKLKSIYNTILSQTISSDAKWMFYGNNYGDIFAQNLCEGFETTKADIYTPNQGPILSLSYYKDCLLVGKVGVVTAYKWKSEKLDISKPAFQILINECGDINTMAIDDQNEHVYIGCGNNSIYQFCLATLAILHEYKGHSNYLHCVRLYDSTLYSAGEDGQIIIWDTNTKQVQKKLKPYKEQTLFRPECGNWQGSVAVFNDWLVCGGGTKASLWHLPSSELIHSFSFPSKVHFCDFVDENVLIAGESKNMLYYNLNGEEAGKIETELISIYNVTHQKDSNFMAVSGAGNKIISLTDLKYIDYYKELYT